MLDGLRAHEQRRGGLAVRQALGDALLVRGELRRLGLEPAAAQDGHAAGALDRGEQQRGPADPGVAADHERVAPARAVSSARFSRTTSAARPISPGAAL
jgi:hypothetical protein